MAFALVFLNLLLGMSGSPAYAAGPEGGAEEVWFDVFLVANENDRKHRIAELV
jgi:hypothetical protein